MISCCLLCHPYVQRPRARFFIGTKGLDCGNGNRVATFQEAQQFQSTICSLSGLGEWDIVNLAGGAAFDGPGYDCELAARDKRGPFENSVCIQGKLYAFRVSW